MMRHTTGRVAAAGLCWLAIVCAACVWTANVWAAEPAADPAEKSVAAEAAVADQPAESEPTDKASTDKAATAKTSADKLALQQQQIAEKYRHLEKVLLRMAELTETTDPTRAALLKQAVKQSGDQLIAAQFEQLVELLRGDQLSRAIENQSNLDKDLQSLLQLLMSEDRADRIQSEKARIREYLKRLNTIITQQKDVQGRTENGDDPKKLSGEQRQLAEKTGELAGKIRENEESKPQEDGNASTPDDAPGDGTAKDTSKSRPADEPRDGAKPPGDAETPPQPSDKPSDKSQDQPGGKDGSQSPPPSQGQNQPSDGNPSSPSDQAQGGRQTPEQDQSQEQDAGQNPTRQRLEAAKQRMEEAQKKLDEAERQGAVEKQEDAIRELEQAKAELEEILRQLREEEIQRVLAMLETRFRQMLEMQREVYDGTVRLDKVPAQQRGRNHEIESSRLSSKETEIVVECDKCLLVLREDATAVAFPEAVGQMQEDMQQVVVRLARTEVGGITQSIEEDILAALGEMIEALKKAQKDQQQKQQQDQPPSDQQEDPALIDMLAELKMIRALQMRVNSRTDRYSKLIEGEQADNAELIEALRRLAEREQRIHRVTRDLEMGKNR